MALSLSSSSGHDNESSLSLKDEDSINIPWLEFENSLNDFSEESYPLLILFNNKQYVERQIPQVNENLSIEDNISIEKSPSFYNIKQSDNLNDNENESIYMWKNSPRLNDDEEKISGLTGDSFSSSFEIHPNQEFDFSLNNEFNLNLDDGKNKSIVNINNENFQIEEINDKLGDSEIEIEEKKKAKINFLISKNQKNLENKTTSENKKGLEKIQNIYIGKKRENVKKDISINIKNNLKFSKINSNLREINKVTVINSKAFKCECGKVFSTEENQRLHYINIHLHEKPYNCSYCGEGFSHRNGKIYHERVYHTFIFPYPCKMCNSVFASKSAMIYHMKSKHKIN